jgi:hypothetical protein
MNTSSFLQGHSEMIVEYSRKDLSCSIRPALVTP